MAKQTKVLATRRDEFVLEKFFNDYIVTWFQEKVVSPVIYEKARKEIDVLKKRARKTTIPSTPCNNTEDEKTAVESLPDDVNQRAKPKRNPPRPSSARGSSNVSQNGTRNRTMNTTDVDIQAVLLENAEIKKKLSKKKDEMYKLSAESDVQLREKDVQLQKLRKALENTKAQVDDLTNRLSKLAGEKLRAGNPDLADLSDSYRPTELGKMFSEIYDNEWSDAFENVLKNDKDEERTIGLLHGIVKKAFTFCSENFENQVTSVRAILLAEIQLSIQDDNVESKPESPALKNATKTTRTANIHNLLKDIRKQMAPQTAENIANEFVEVGLESFTLGFGIKRGNIHKSLRQYAFRCAELSWFMMVCDPQMALSDDKEGKAFDLNIYKPYTKSVRDLKNPVVNLSVWPALHLNDGGPLIAKGVAQPGEGKSKK